MTTLDSQREQEATVELKGPICHDFIELHTRNFYISNFCNYLTVGINLFIRILIIYIIEKVGGETQTKKTVIISYFVFLGQYFNTAWLPILANANLTDQSQILGNLIGGKEPDFDSNWYKEDGKSLIMTMIINSMLPPIIEICLYVQRRLKIFWDKGCVCCS